MMNKDNKLKNINSFPLISVIIPIYNVEKYLHKCLNSIINQSYKNLQIIIVDDGSTDNCYQIYDEYANNDKRIEVVQKKNGGLSDARNIGLDLVKGDYILFIDSDDFIDINLIDTCLKYMLQDELSVVMFEANIIDENSVKIGTRFNVFEKYTITSVKTALDMIITDKVGSQVWKALYKKECWNNVRFPVGKLYEDIYTTFKAYAGIDGKVGFIQDKLYNYRLNNNGISLSKSNMMKKVENIFESFIEQYNYAKENCKENIVNNCLRNVTGSAINTLYFDAMNENSKKEAKNFLIENSKKIYKNKEISFKLKIKVFLELNALWILKILRKIKRNNK